MKAGSTVMLALPDPRRPDRVNPPTNFWWSFLTALAWSTCTGFPLDRQSTRNTTSFSQTIWPRWALRQFLTVPIVQTLLPVTFAYSLSSEAVVMRQLRRWKRLWRRSLTRSHKWTSMGPSRSCWNSTSALQPKQSQTQRRDGPIKALKMRVWISGWQFDDL